MCEFTMKMKRPYQSVNPPFIFVSVNYHLNERSEE